jgi:uncharacterized protein YgiM (DUF1202 family)
VRGQTGLALSSGRVTETIEPLPGATPLAHAARMKVLKIGRSRTAWAHRARPSLWLPAALVALVGLVLVSPAPTAAAGSTTMIPACSGVNARTGASTTSAIATHLAVDAKVTVVATVTGSHWSTTCPTAKSGSNWYRISAINGKTIASIYGRTYLYAATGVLGAVPVATSATVDVFGADLTRLLNLDRAALGKPAYLVDARLASIARDAPFTCPTNPAMKLFGRARDMATRNYFGHTIAGCYVSGSTPYRSLTIVRTVFGYTGARSEILHWNSYGTATTKYRLGCDINGANCKGGTTSAPYTVTLAQRSFMSSAPHRAAELNSYQRVGCASASKSGRTYYACLFADGGSTIAPTTAAATSATTTKVPACSGVNLRTGASTVSKVITRLALGTRVTVVATIAGSAWRTSCPISKSGSKWYRISAINGKSVMSLYGRTYLYAATGVLKSPS